MNNKTIMNLERYILSNGIAESDLYDIIQEFANVYIDSGFTKEVNVFKSKKNPDQFLINYSEDTDFERFNYLVSCILYSKDNKIDFSNNVFGYWTVSENDDTNKALYKKRIQLYVSENEEDGDNVYAIAQGGTETIKLGFAHGEEYIPLGKKEFDFFEEKLVPSDFYPSHIIYGVKDEKPISKSKKPGCSLFFLLTLSISVLVIFFACKEKAEIPSIEPAIKIENTIKKKLEIPYYQKDSIVYNWYLSIKDFSENHKGFTTKTKVSKNDHDDSVYDTIKTLQFQKSEIITVTTSDYFYGVWSANIQDAELVFDNSIVIGMQKTQLENCIKMPIERDTIRIGNLEQTSIFEFQFSNNILKSIIFEGYID